MTNLLPVAPFTAIHISTFSMMYLTDATSWHWSVRRSEVHGTYEFWGPQGGHVHHPGLASFEGRKGDMCTTQDWLASYKKSSNKESTDKELEDLQDRSGEFLPGYTKIHKEVDMELKEEGWQVWGQGWQGHPRKQHAQEQQELQQDPQGGKK